MAFTKALYYPWIDIRNESWLKNAILYWQEIQTIVPEDVKFPYTGPAREFADEGILVPYRVSRQEIEGLENEVEKYLDSPEAKHVRLGDDERVREYGTLHLGKLTENILNKVSIAVDRLPVELKSRIHSGLYKGTGVFVDRRFLDFYMTLLATRISENRGLGLLTEIGTNDKLAKIARLDANEPMQKTVAQGALAELSLQHIQIDPNTPVANIIKFRKNHADELGLFRTKVEELTKVIEDDLPIHHLHQKVQDIHINQVKPAVNSLKAALTGIGIRHATGNFLKLTFFSVSPTALISVAFGLAAPYALLAGLGISLIASTINYNVAKREVLRKNEFSYVLAAERGFR